MRVFGIFEGGGVRGYAHVGALRALERRGIEFEAVAGTSIGAIVAALVAAGYQADDLFVEDGNGGQRGLGTVASREFFSAADWKVADRVRRDLAAYNWFARLWRRCRLPSPLDIRSSLLLASSLWLSTPLIWLGAPLLYLRHYRAVSRLWRRFGLVNTDAIHTWLDAALRRRLGLEDVPRRLVFGDLPTPLRVIVSDVSAGTMRVVGADASEPLVEAVVASASFPLFFAPANLNGKSLVDGGILSNLPAWVFDRQRSAAPVCIPTIALRLAGRDDGLDGALETLARFTPRLLTTVLDGARELQFRRIDEHHLIPIQAQIDVLAFREMELRRAALVAAGENAVEIYFQTQFGPVDPRRAQALLSVIAAHTRQILSTTAVVRAWVLTAADDEFLRLSYSANMEEDSDDQLLVRRSSPGAAYALSRREPVLVTIPTLVETFGRHPLYKHEHALRSQRVVTACALPIFADPTEWGRAPARRSEPIAVLGLDLDEDARLRFLSVSVEDRLATYAQIAGEKLRDRIVTPFTSTSKARAVSSRSALSRVAPGVEVYQRKTRSLIFDDDISRLLAEADAVQQQSAN